MEITHYIILKIPEIIILYYNIFELILDFLVESWKIRFLKIKTIKRGRLSLL